MILGSWPNVHGISWVELAECRVNNQSLRVLTKEVVFVTSKGQIKIVLFGKLLKHVSSNATGTRKIFIKETPSSRRQQIQHVTLICLGIGLAMVIVNEILSDF